MRGGASKGGGLRRGASKGPPSTHQPFIPPFRPSPRPSPPPPFQPPLKPPAKGGGMDPSALRVSPLFLRPAAANATPGLVAAPGRAMPSCLRADTSVVWMANCPQTICHDFKASAVHDIKRRQVHVPHENVRGDTGSCATATSSGKPLRPNTPASEHVVQWWPTESNWRPHRQVLDDRGAPERGQVDRPSFFPEW